jgi:hypothetical protein
MDIQKINVYPSMPSVNRIDPAFARRSFWGSACFCSIAFKEHFGL